MKKRNVFAMMSLTLAIAGLGLTACDEVEDGISTEQLVQFVSVGDEGETILDALRFKDVTVSAGLANLASSLYMSFEPSPSASHIVLGDMDHDGDADIYLSNALRCRVPSGQKASKKEISACRKYLLMDIDLRCRQTNTRRIIHCLQHIINNTLYTFIDLFNRNCLFA